MMNLLEETLDLNDNDATQKRPSATVPLYVHVKNAVDNYFQQLNGHDATDLYDMVIQEVEKPLIEATLANSGFNQTKAAKTLGLSRSTLRKKIEKYQIG